MQHINPPTLTPRQLAMATPDLAATIALTLLAILWGFLPIHAAFPGIFFALPLIFFLPGYALTRMIFPTDALGFTERCLISIGTSIAIVALSGVVMNWLPGGLNSSGFTLFVGTITLIFALVTYNRQWQQQHIEMIALPDWAFTRQHFALFGLAIFLIVGAMTIQVIDASHQTSTHFTQLWTLPVQSSQAVTIGIKNQENTKQTYTIQVSVAGKVIKTYSTITLANGAMWQQNLTLPTTTAATKVDVTVYRSSAPTVPYRSASVTVTGMAMVTPPKK